jgi:hypothetical protein
MFIIAERVKMVNDEIITLPEFRIDQLRSLPFRRRIYLDEKARAAVENHFYAEPVPAIVFPYNGSDPEYQEMISPLNFLTIAESAISELTRTEQEKVNRQVQLEMESKRKRIEQRSPTAVAYARALDEVGRILKGELGEINKYVEKRSTDRELIRQVDKMLGDAYKRFVIEASRIIIE